MSEDTEYRYRCYCEWCEEYSEWYETDGRAYDWRHEHVQAEHPAEPMAERANRVQRYPVADIDGDLPGDEDD